MTIKFSVSSECGNVRKHNEDNVAVVVNKYGMILGILCDGMGGHYGGEAASLLTVNYFKEAFQNMQFDISAEFLTKEDIIYWAQNTVDELSIYIKNYADLNQKFLDMGTTLVVSIFFNNLIYILNIGDSRAYYIINDSIKQITEDHNVGNLLNNKNYHPNNIEILAPTNALTSALGPSKKYMLDLFTIQIVEGYVLLASDGFYNFISEKNIINILNKNMSLPNKIDNLINLAKPSSNDNLSIILFEIIFPKDAK